MSIRARLGAEVLDLNGNLPSQLNFQAIPGQDGPVGTDWQYICPHGFTLEPHHHTTHTAACVHISEGPLTYECPEDWTLSYRHDRWKCVRHVIIDANLVCPEGYLRYFKTCTRTELVDPDALTCPHRYSLQWNQEGDHQKSASCLKVIHSNHAGTTCPDEDALMIFLTSASPSSHKKRLGNPYVVDEENNDELDFGIPQMICLNLKSWVSDITGKDDGVLLDELSNTYWAKSAQSVFATCNAGSHTAEASSIRPLSGLIHDLKLPICQPQESEGGEAINEDRQAFESVEGALSWAFVKGSCPEEKQQLECNEHRDWLSIPVQKCPMGFSNVVDFGTLMRPESLLQWPNPNSSWVSETTYSGNDHEPDDYDSHRNDVNQDLRVRLEYKNRPPLKCSAFAVTQPMPSCRSGWTVSPDHPNECIRQLSVDPSVVCPSGFLPEGPAWPHWSKYLVGSMALDDDKGKDGLKTPSCRGENVVDAVPTCEPGYFVDSRHTNCIKELITSPALRNFRAHRHSSRPQEEAQPVVSMGDPWSGETDSVLPCYWSSPGVLNCAPVGVEDRSAFHTRGYAKASE